MQKSSKIMVNVVKEILQKDVRVMASPHIKYQKNEFKFEVKVTRSKRTRRITLRVCPILGECRVTVPYYYNTDLLEKFITRNLSWISSRLSERTPQVILSEGSEVPLLGLDRKVIAKSECRTNFHLTPNSLIIPRTDLVFRHQIKSIFFQIAQEFFIESCNKFSQKLGVTFLKISIKDPKSRWGSCSSDKKLMFSWRLIMAPKNVSLYVAAHEIAHLIHMNHSEEFWEVVRLLFPNYRNQRTWLRKNGRSLHRFMF